jgi:4-hydroxy-tetrahydrodipicolinate reductase
LHRKNGAFISSSNFSLGVNIFFEINEYLAKMMAKLDHYSIEMELHHTQKLDAPSGTAISLAKE